MLLEFSDGTLVNVQDIIRIEAIKDFTVINNSMKPDYKFYKFLVHYTKGEQEIIGLNEIEVKEAYRRIREAVVDFHTDQKYLRCIFEIDPLTLPPFMNKKG